MTGRFGPGLLAGLLAALLFLSLIHGAANGPLLAFFAPLPLMMAALGLEQAAAAMATSVGAMAVGLVGDWSFGLTFLALAGLPSLMVANRALLWRRAENGDIEWYPIGRLLAGLTVSAMAVFVAMALTLPPHSEGVRGWMVESLSRTLDAVGDEVTAEQRQLAASTLAAVLPGMVMTVWMLMAVVNALAAQAILVGLRRNRRPNPAYGGLDLPDWLGGVLLVTALLGAAVGGTVGYVAGNMAAVALVPFSLLGVATIHRHVTARPGAAVGLVFLYGVLVVFNVWALIPASGLGLVRFLQMRFRRRVPSDGGKEK